MSATIPMTPLMVEVLRAVMTATLQKTWFRARRSGERVTLASLYRHGVLTRRAWRGKEGEADAAHEYRVAEQFLKNENEDTMGLFQIALQAHLDVPSKETWAKLASMVIPGSTRTVWQAWVRIDSSAPVGLPSSSPDVTKAADRWPCFPDPFTTRRAVREALAGRVPSGLGALLADRGPAVPR